MLDFIFYKISAPPSRNQKSLTVDESVNWETPKEKNNDLSHTLRIFDFISYSDRA
jgi:hypothetical protein